jgi:hypothetical protein
METEEKEEKECFADVVVICNDDTEKRDAGYESVTNSA